MAVLALGTLVSLGGWTAFLSLESPTRSGWGIDACLSCHVPAGEVPGYLQLLRGSDIRWLRERGIASPISRAQKLKSRNGEMEGPLFAFQPFCVSGSGERSATAEQRVWRAERRAGFRVVAFASSFRPLPLDDSVDQLPEDLLAVYWAFRETAIQTAGEVDAWEMVGEPETFFCRDLPDRVAAFQKAVYLALTSARDTPPSEEEGSLKRGDGETERAPSPARQSAPQVPVVLMGALAFPPGPWLEAAAANGLFDYTDAINLHHYGFAKDLGDVIAAHRAVASRWTNGRSLPVWVTEAGLNNIPKRDWRNATARAAQADYLIECATQAIQQGVAVFMPFILVHRGDPFAMTEAANDVHPAWERYRDFTREHALNPAGPVAAPPPAPNPVVLQWLPDSMTCTPSKTSRSYWFESDGDGAWSELEGELRVYNFSATPVRVRVVAAGEIDPRLSLAWGGGQPDEVVTLAPLSRRVLPVKIGLTGNAYLRAELQFRAETLDAKDRGLATSPLAFAVETMPTDELPHRELRLAPGPPPETFPYVGGTAPFVTTSRSASCRGLNGVTVVEDDGAGSLTFDVKESNEDALTPPQAIFSLPDGLPPATAGFLRLRATDGRGRPAYLRVDLVDVDGQRFSIVEGLGRNPLVDSGDTVLLGYNDFHRWVFGNCRPGVGFDPRRIRGLQLRFCEAGAGTRFHVNLDVLDFGGR